MRVSYLCCEYLHKSYLKDQSIVPNAETLFDTLFKRYELKDICPPAIKEFMLSLFKNIPDKTKFIMQMFANVLMQPTDTYNTKMFYEFILSDEVTRNLKINQVLKELKTLMNVPDVAAHPSLKDTNEVSFMLKNIYNSKDRKNMNRNTGFISMSFLSKIVKNHN